jgi:hypothetical protein
MRFSRPGVFLMGLPAHAFAEGEDNESGDRYIGNGFEVAVLRMEGYDIPRDGGMISYGSLRER